MPHSNHNPTLTEVLALEQPVSENIHRMTGKSEKQDSKEVLKCVTCLQRRPTRISVEILCVCIAPSNESLFSFIYRRDNDFTQNKNLYCVLLEHCSSEFKLCMDLQAKQKVSFNLSSDFSFLFFNNTKAQQILTNSA